MQSTDNKVIYTCIWQDKGFLFLKHGRNGKTYYFLHFMNYVPVTCCLPLPPPKLCVEPGPAKPKELTQDASLLQVTAEFLLPGDRLSHVGGGKSQPRKQLLLLRVKKWKAWRITVHKVDCETRHSVFSAGPSLTYVTTCDRRKLTSEVNSAHRNSRLETRCQKSFFTWYAAESRFHIRDLFWSSHS